MINIEAIKGKNVLVRGDLDVPIKDGLVENDFRLRSLLPTLNLCLQYAHRTVLIGHMGRPEGKDPSLSLVPVQKWLKSTLNRDIPLDVSGFSPGECWKGESPLCMMENLRFDEREQTNNREFAHQLTDGADVYVYEAFATYNPCTSLQTIPEVIHTITGIQFDLETTTLSNLLKNPVHPTLLIASGAKLDKLEIINKISKSFDNVFLGGKFAKPEHLTADGFDINDFGLKELLSLMEKSKTIVLNGPLGKYEDKSHEKATRTIYEALKKSSAFTILGGGDTLASIPSLGFSYTDYGFVSTGGGAMLELLATGTHPLLDILKDAKV